MRGRRRGPSQDERNGTSASIICRSREAHGNGGWFLRVTHAARRALKSAAFVSVAVLAALAFAACTGRPNDHPTGDVSVPTGFPGQVVTEQGQNAASLYLPVFLIAVAVFILVEGLVIIITLRFRRKKTDSQLPPQTHGNNVLEVVWTIIPAIIVLGLFVLSMSVLVKNDATARQPRPDRRRHRLPVAVDIRLHGPGPELHRRRRERSGDGAAGR